MANTKYVRLRQGDGRHSRSDIDVSPSDFHTVRPLLSNSASGEWTLPRRIDSTQWVGKWKVVGGTWPALVLQWCTCSLDFVVADALAHEFVRFAPKDVQILRVDLDWGRRVPKSAPAYWYVNIHRCVDCIHVERSGVYSTFDPTCMWLTDSDAKLTLDASRIPDGIGAFHLKYVPNEVIVSQSLATMLQRHAPGAFIAQPIHFANENEHRRKARLRQLKKHASAELRKVRAKQAFNSANGVGSELDILLTTTATKHFDRDNEINNTEVEIFDGARAVEETHRLRDWKELEWPKHLVCISEDGRGGHFALDLSKVKDGDCPVVYFDHELAKIDKKTGKITPQFELAAKTFEAWIKRLKRGGSALPK